MRQSIRTRVRLRRLLSHTCSPKQCPFETMSIRNSITRHAWDPRERGITTRCSHPAEPCPSPCERPLIKYYRSAWVKRVQGRNRETKKGGPTSEFLGSIAGEGSLDLLVGTDGAILGALNVALSLGLLVLNIALSLTLLAGSLERVEASQVTDRFFNLPDGILNTARSFAVNEPNVSVERRQRNGGGGVRGNGR